MLVTISLMKRLLRSHFAETVAGLSGGLVGVAYLVSKRLPVVGVVVGFAAGNRGWVLRR